MAPPEKQLPETDQILRRAHDMMVSHAHKPVVGKEMAVAPFVEAAKLAKKLGLGINAGHDLSLENLNFLYQNIPCLDEVSIGHALISDALYLGLEKTIRAYKNCLK